MKLLIQKLKIVLQSKLLVLLLIALTIVYSYIVINNNMYKSHYSINSKSLVGVIQSIKINNDRIVIELKAKEKILATYYINNNELLNKLKKHKIGDKVLIEGKFLKPNNNNNFNLFNYRKYLLSKHIYYNVNIKKIKKIGCSNNVIYIIKNKIYNRINKVKRSKEYLYMFIMGDNSLIDSDIKNVYKDNGIIHLFCISGMHVSFIILVLNKTLIKLIKNQRIIDLIIIIFLILYSLLITISPSIIRTVVFYVLLRLNKKIGIKTIYLYIIFTCIIIIINPYNIYNSGFLYSYIITFYLILFSKLIGKYNNYFIKSLVLSIISFLASIPIMINNNFSINFLSIVNNITLIPYVTFIVFPLSVITFIIPILDSVLYFFINILEGINIFLYSIKIFNITLCYIPHYIFILYYVLITFVIYKMYKGRYYYILLLIIVLFIHNNYLYLNNNTIITFINVGQGDCTLIVLPNNKGNILIDTGGIIKYKKNNYNLTDQVLVPYLKSMGVKKIEYLILTHGDNDHIGEAINLVKKYRINNVILNSGNINENEKKIINILKCKYYFYNKNELNINGYKFYFLNKKNNLNENMDSLVIYTKINNENILLMSDAPKKIESNILDEYNLPKLDIIKVGHHGSNTSSSEELIKKCKIAIVSVGKNNMYNHPSIETINILKKYKVKTYLTSIDGAIKIIINKNGKCVRTTA